MTNGKNLKEKRKERKEAIGKRERTKRGDLKVRRTKGCEVIANDKAERRDLNERAKGQK
jgi:hypothetical protein